jgi:hypothetical protein
MSLLVASWQVVGAHCILQCRSMRELRLELMHYNKSAIHKQSTYLLSILLKIR